MANLDELRDDCTDEQFRRCLRDMKEELLKQATASALWWKRYYERIERNAQIRTLPPG
jgi:hypothetical protein